MVKKGDRIDKYLLDEPIGEGGFAAVFHATDTSLGRRCGSKNSSALAQSAMKSR